MATWYTEENGKIKWHTSKKIRKPPYRRPGNRIKGRIRLQKRIIKLSRQQAYMMFGRAISKDGELKNQTVHRYIEEPLERYEWDGEKIIRTIDAFRFIGDKTVISGICRSFNRLNASGIRANRISDNSEIEDVDNRVLKIFRHRYWVHKCKMFTSDDTDLNWEMKWWKMNIKPYNYFIVQIKHLFDDKFTTPLMFRQRREEYKDIYPKLPLKLNQEQIIEKLKNGTIKDVSKFGDPNKKYTPDEILKIIG